MSLDSIYSVYQMNMSSIQKQEISQNQELLIVLSTQIVGVETACINQLTLYSSLLELCYERVKGI